MIRQRPGEVTIDAAARAAVGIGAAASPATLGQLSRSLRLYDTSRQVTAVPVS